MRRHAEIGHAGLESRSRRPTSSPKRKVLAEHESWITELRRERKLGARRIQARRLHSFLLSLATIHKVMKRHASDSAAHRPAARLGRIMRATMRCDSDLARLTVSKSPPILRARPVRKWRNWQTH
jgi:hypothetical protein